MKYKVTAEYVVTKEMVVTLKDGETDAYDPSNWDSIDDEHDNDCQLAQVVYAESDE